MSPEKLIIFDYSGTLSLEASLFARPDSLMKQLEESGLKDLGVDSPEVFWEQVVNPAWMEGSTTAAGYKKILENSITAILCQNMSIISGVRISDAVSSFVNRYLGHSRIDRRWEAVLHRLNAHPSIIVIVATDHYAEATGAMIKFLHEFRIKAAAAKDAFINLREARFIVANSADMGFHKADARFWELLKSRLNLDAVRHILIIDDFGFNEQEGDRYGERNKVEARREQTLRMLETVFQADVQVIPMMIEADDREKDALYGNLIVHASAAIDRCLASGTFP
jgi:hypothetical protein